MPAGSTIALFALASLALAVVPGPAVTYIVTQSAATTTRRFPIPSRSSVCMRKASWSTS